METIQILVIRRKYKTSLQRLRVVTLAAKYLATKQWKGCWLSTKSMVCKIVFNDSNMVSEVYLFTVPVHEVNYMTFYIIFQTRFKSCISQIRSLSKCWNKWILILFNTLCTCVNKYNFVRVHWKTDCTLLWCCKGQV